MILLLLTAALASATPDDGERLRDLSFRDDLDQRMDLSLAGLHTARVLPLSLPRGWDLTEDPELHLRYDHSAVLDSERSMITVELNGQALSTWRLTRENAARAETVVPLPRELLEPWNELSIHATHHLSEDCEDPFDPALWTRISAESSVQVRYEPVPVTPELLDWPYPLYDVRGYGPIEVTLAMPEEVRAAHLESLSAIGTALGRTAGHRGLVVGEPITDLADATTHVLVIGTLDELPLVSGAWTPEVFNATGKVEVMPNPYHPELAVVVVTGTDDWGLLAAARALSDADQHAVLSGGAAAVNVVGHIQPPPPKDVPLPIPSDRDRFTLADLGLQDQTVRGFYAPAISVPLRFEGDSHPREDEAALYLQFAYGAQVDPVQSRVEVRLNGASLRSWQLDEPGGSQQQQLRLPLPHKLLEPASTLEIDFQLVPKTRAGHCLRIRDRQLWATVFASTEIHAPRDRFADLPDLATLRYDFWPYGRDLDQGVMIVVSDDPDPHELSAALRLAAHLGRMGTEPDPALAITSARQDLLWTRREPHAILLVGDRPHGTWLNLTGAGALLQLVDGATRGAHRGGWVQQLRHPEAPRGTILAVLAASSGGLTEMVERLIDPRVQQHMEGGASKIDGEGPVLHLEARTRERVGTIHLRSRARNAAEQAYLFVGLGVLLMATVVSSGVRRWAIIRGGII